MTGTRSILIVVPEVLDARPRLSGIAIVDDKWSLCGCFSASDLRVLPSTPRSWVRDDSPVDSSQGITVDSFAEFDRSILGFLQKVTKTVRSPSSCILRHQLNR